MRRHQDYIYICNKIYHFFLNIVQVICCICRNIEATYCFRPCGHLATCEECCVSYEAQNIARDEDDPMRKKCPVCRREYDCTQKVIPQSVCIITNISIFLRFFTIEIVN